MTPTNHYSNVPQVEKPMETFPQPQTIPNGWDMSDLFTQPSPTGSDLPNVESNEETGKPSWDVH